MTSYLPGKLACPNCQHRYLLLHLVSRTTCPACKSGIKTDMKVISLVETLLGFPLLWALGSLLRVWLQDSTGALSYSLLVIPMVLVHIVVVGLFATAKLDD
jgi:hypothetical protein